MSPMIDRRNLFVVWLSLIPVLVSIGFGVYAMWITGFWKILFWFFPACWITAWLGAKFWYRKDEVAELAPLEIPAHYTERDQAAAKIVRKHQESFATIAPASLSKVHHYVGEVEAMAREMANVYRGTDAHEEPVNSLTIVEFAAAIRLAVDDLEGMVLQTVPGSQMLTIGQWKNVAKTPHWISRLSDLYWAGSILINPMNLLRYGTSRLTTKPLLGKLQSEIVATIYMQFIRQAGFYLIEMYSGRLRGGAETYLQTFGTQPVAVTKNELEHVAIELMDVTFCVLGQTCTGKSSLINALIPGQNIVTSAVPETQSVTRYDFALESSQTKLSLLDTPGYGANHPSQKQAKRIEGEIASAVSQADIVLLTLDAHSPAKSLDVKMIQQLAGRISSSPNMKLVPVIAVLTHVDLLPPASRWEPPYQIDAPTCAKEESIAGICQYVTELFGKRLRGVAPVCLRPESNGQSERANNWGVSEHLLPLMAKLLEDGKMVSLLKAYEKGLGENHWKRVLEQTRTLASEGVRLWIDRQNKS